MRLFQRALLGEALDEPVGLEDANVREAIEDRAALSPALDESGAPQHGEVLAHVRHLAADRGRQVAHGELAAGQRFEHAQALRIGEGPTDRRIALAVEVARGRDGGVQHLDESCHYLRKHASSLSGCSRALCDTPIVDTADRIVSLDAIAAARERIAGRVHRTPLLSSADRGAR